MESKEPDSRPSLESSGSRSPVREPQGNKFQDMSPGPPPHPGASLPARGGTQEEGRKRKILRTIGLSVGSLFLIAIAVFGWWAYRQWTDMKEMVESARRISSAIEANMGTLDGRLPDRPAWQAGRFSESSASLPLAMRASKTGKSKLPVVPFSLEPGGLPRGVHELVRNSQKMFKALSKYKDRPLVREFLNDLNSDPKFKKAWEERSTGNPIKLFSQITNMKNLTVMIEKYAERPEFAILMIEVMNDPELKLFFESINPGITGGTAAGPGSRPSLESSGSRSPSPAPPSTAIPVGVLIPPHTMRGVGAGAPDSPKAEGSLRTMTLDPSQIQGNKSTSSISVRPAVVPPP